MITITKCKHCNVDMTLPFGSISADIQLNLVEWCEHCKNMETKTTTYGFCSIGCLVEFMKLVIDGQKELKL